MQNLSTEQNETNHSTIHNKCRGNIIQQWSLQTSEEIHWRGRKKDVMTKLKLHLVQNKEMKDKQENLKNVKKKNIKGGKLWDEKRKE